MRIWRLAFLLQILYLWPYKQWTEHKVSIDSYEPSITSMGIMRDCQENVTACQGLRIATAQVLTR